jgi:hypothetical protein
VGKTTLGKTRGTDGGKNDKDKLSPSSKGLACGPKKPKNASRIKSLAFGALFVRCRRVFGENERRTMCVLRLVPELTGSVHPCEPPATYRTEVSFSEKNEGRVGTRPKGLVIILMVINILPDSPTISKRISPRGCDPGSRLLTVPAPKD